MIGASEIGISLCKNHGDIMVLIDYNVPSHLLSLCKDGCEIQKTNSEIKIIKYHDVDYCYNTFIVFYRILSFKGYYYANPVECLSMPIKEDLNISIEEFDKIKRKIESLHIFS